MVAIQVYVTALWTGMMLLVYRSRPDIEAADPAASTRRYRRFLAACTRAVLTLLALVNLSVLLVALQNWQVYRLTGAASALPVLPFVVGLLVLAAVSFRAGQGGSRLPGGAGGRGPAAGTDRDDDRFWKAGLIYVNRDDPALLVGSRFGVGWPVRRPVGWPVSGQSAKRSGGSAGPGSAGYVLTVSDPARAAPAVTRALVAAGADVLSIAESRHSLEDVYLELIEDTEGRTR